MPKKIGGNYRNYWNELICWLRKHNIGDKIYVKDIKNLYGDIVELSDHSIYTYRSHLTNAGFLKKETNKYGIYIIKKEIPENLFLSECRRIADEIKEEKKKNSIHSIWKNS